MLQELQCQLLLLKRLKNLSELKSSAQQNALKQIPCVQLTDVLDTMPMEVVQQVSEVGGFQAGPRYV